MNDVHAGGVKGGITDCRSPETPFSISFERLGNRPFAAQGWIKSQVAESSPMITTFGCSIFPFHSFAKRQVILAPLSIDSHSGVFYNRGHNRGRFGFNRVSVSEDFPFRTRSNRALPALSARASRVPALSSFDSG